MTFKETINNLEMIKIAFIEPVTKEQRELIDDTFDMAIKALKQEPYDESKLYEHADEFIEGCINDLFQTVLDEIRAKIEHCKNKYYMSDDGKTVIAYQNDTIEQVLRIIDKYRKVNKE